MDGQLDVAVADPDLRVSPGDTVTTAIRLRNGSDRSALFRVEIEGPPAAWLDLGRIAQRGRRIAAGAEAEVTLAIRVPADATLADLPLIVRVAA
ncbi:MAG: hypothetical protein AVDCRST_MAG73-709, partial [uncultured Thermomicrobiales bacterium]